MDIFFLWLSLLALHAVSARALKIKTSIQRVRIRCFVDRSRSRKMSRGDGGRVYIGDLGSGGSKPELEREFEKYGPLKSVWVARNPPGELAVSCGPWHFKCLTPDQGLPLLSLKTSVMLKMQ